MIPSFSGQKQANQSTFHRTEETDAGSSAPTNTDIKRKGSPTKPELKREPPGPESEGTLDLAAMLMIRRLAGKPFESAPVIQRLKAAQQGMRRAARNNPAGSSNLLGDCERSQFRHVVMHPMQREIATRLAESIFAHTRDKNMQALYECWPSGLYHGFGPTLAHARILFEFVAGTAVARLGGTQNCLEKTMENLVHLSPAIFENQRKGGGMTHSTDPEVRLVIGAADDHYWLEVRHPQAYECVNQALVAHPHDLILDGWSGERKMPLLREDAIYPASARYYTRLFIPNIIAARLPKFIDDFVENLRVCPAVSELWQEKFNEFLSKKDKYTAHLKNLQGIRGEKLPISSSRGIYLEPPHPLRAEVRAAARKGFAKHAGSAAPAMHLEIVATGIARDLGMSVRKATQHASRIADIAKEIAAEPMQRRMILGKDAVFEDGKSLMAPHDIIRSLDEYGDDVPALHAALWRLEDALVIADAHALKESTGALRRWWSQAEVPLPIHHHVFDILANGRIGDPGDFLALTEMIMMLPVLAQSQATLVTAAYFLALALKRRGVSPQEAADFRENIRPQVERRYEAMRESGLDIYFEEDIQGILNRASGLPWEGLPNQQGTVEVSKPRQWLTSIKQRLFKH